MDDVILSCLDPPDVVLSCLDPPDVDAAVHEEVERASLDRRHMQKVRKKTKKKAAAPPRSLRLLDRRSTTRPRGSCCASDNCKLRSVSFEFCI